MAKLLLVEDNEYNRDMLMRRLAKKGFEVVVAVDGGEGVAKARSEKPDLILMDMHLPVLDGWEATKELKESDDTRTIPIIPLTADAMAGSREQVLDPVNAIIQVSEILLAETTDLGQDAFVADLRKIHASGRRLREMIDEFLTPETFVGQEGDTVFKSLQSRVRHDLFNA